MSLVVISAAAVRDQKLLRLKLNMNYICLCIKASWMFFLHYSPFSSVLFWHAWNSISKIIESSLNYSSDFSTGLMCWLWEPGKRGKHFLFFLIWIFFKSLRSSLVSVLIGRQRNTYLGINYYLKLVEEDSWHSTSCLT